LSMQKRWLLNLVLLCVVAGLVAFLYLKPKTNGDDSEDQYEVSSFKLAEFTGVQIDFPSRSQVLFEKVDGFWRLMAPYKTRADNASVQRILSIIAAKTKTKITPANQQSQFSASELDKFGLSNPAIKLSLIRSDASKEQFLFGTYNPVTDEQYIAHGQSIYLLPINYSEAASTQVIELVDKSPINPQDKIVGFDFSHLEQWEDAKLKLDLVEGNWKVSIKEAKPTQNELNEWLNFSWVQTSAQAVELYTPDLRKQYPYLEIKMADGHKVRFNKIQESPNLLLARPDEGIIYTYPSDEGFTMLNPPINAVAP
jgi:hypothetical protein